jgi:hypothetical protein
MQPMVIRLVLLLLMVASGVGMFVAVDTAETRPLKQAQETALNRFGADLLSLCQSATKTRNGSVPNNARISVINSDTKTVYEIYNEALPDNMRATDKSDVTVLLCLSENKSVFAKDEYGQPTKYTCTRYARDLTGYLIDIKTGKTLNYRSFEGQLPPECPEKTDVNLTRTGDIPPSSDITDWLTSSAGDNV